VWTGKFLYPERKSCGFKNIRIRVDGALDFDTFAIDHFTVVCSGTWPLDGCEAGVDLVLIQT